MLLLVSVSDKINIITSAAVTVDVHCSFMDYDAVAVTPGRKNTNIATAATTDVTGSPGAGIQRNIKSLHVRNKHAATSVDVTVQHTDGAIAVELYKTTLSAEASFQYTNDLGFMQL